MTISAQAQASYAKEADYRDTFYGGNAAVAALRCFRRYDRNATVDIEDQYGRLRWMGQKQARVYGIVHRLSVSGQKQTMTSIAKEAMCATSTVSRAILKFQAWGMFAIDISRGRNGGISVRLRTLTDNLQCYAKAAWERIRATAIRARINVASLITGTSSGSPETVTEVSTLLTVSMDATFSEEARIERDGARLLAGEITLEEAFAAAGRAGPRPGEADLEYQRAEQWARECISEIRRLEAGEPDWDVYLDNVRSSYGLS